MPTTHRTIRADDTVWNPAEAKAKSEGLTMSELIRMLLTAYAQNSDAK